MNRAERAHTHTHARPEREREACVTVETGAQHCSDFNRSERIQFYNTQRMRKTRISPRLNGKNEQLRQKGDFHFS